MPFVVRAASIDETRRGGRGARCLRPPAGAGQGAGGWRAAPDELVLGADTVVVAGARASASRRDAADAAAMLRHLAGRSHEVLTGVALVRAGAPVAVEVAATRVTFAPLTEAEVAWYVATAEPYDKAGGYAVQGLASRFVTAIDGLVRQRRRPARRAGLPADRRRPVRTCWRRA